MRNRDTYKMCKIISIVLSLMIFPAMDAVPQSSMPRLVDVSKSISIGEMRQLERQFGLASHGSGWMRLDDKIIPCFHLVCHRPMQVSEARQLYSRILSRLSLRVVQQCEKYGQNCKEMSEIPVELMISFVSSDYKNYFYHPFINLISNSNKTVSYIVLERDKSGYSVLYREPEWNLVQWSDQYSPEIDLEQVKSCD